MEVLWNTVMGILNHRLTMVIQLHNTLHGFHTDRGTGTASLEANMLQHLMAIREEVLYKIFYFYINPMVPWTAAAAYKSLRRTEWGTRPYTSSGGTGTA